MMCLKCVKKRIADNTKTLHSLEEGSENYVNLKEVISSDRRGLVDYLKSIGSHSLPTGNYVIDKKKLENG